MSEKLLAVVQADGGGAEEPTHASYEIRIGWLQNQVKVVSPEPYLFRKAQEETEETEILNGPDA